MHMYVCTYVAPTLDFAAAWGRFISRGCENDVIYLLINRRNIEIWLAIKIRNPAAIFPQVDITYTATH